MTSDIAERGEDHSAAAHRRTYDHTYVRRVFDSIAHRYDLLNHLLSSGIDIVWRKKAIRLLRSHHPQTILDVATGTADLAIEAARLRTATIVGIDIAPEMLKRGKEKIARRGLSHLISLELGTAESMRFEDESFDAVTVAFGVRNFTKLDQGLAEMYRVLRPGGVALILEFSKPKKAPLKQLYNWYFRSLLPRIGGWISNCREAYEYLPNTVEEFPDGKEFASLLQNHGFARIAFYPLTFGIATIYLGYKPVKEVQ
jgi:demethylmenaquinone methyltransferase/2-methoxy-6-polyprenyl-1,4-benzoquinol methylase